MADLSAAAVVQQQQQQQQLQEEERDPQQQQQQHDADAEWLALRLSFVSSGDMMRLGYPAMSAAWRLFLFGNGSPTHHLALLTGSPTRVDVIGLTRVGDAAIDGGGAGEDDGPTAAVAAIATPRSRRQVWLRNARGERLGYAATWLSERDVGAVFPNQRAPIGENIMENRTELFRDMKSVFCGSSPALERAFGHPGPFWGRSYLFWRGDRPVTFIYEVFSPALDKYMGAPLA